MSGGSWIVDGERAATPHPPSTIHQPRPSTSFPADPVHFFGALALLLARPFAEWAVANFARYGGMQSRRLVALAGAFAPGAPIPVHRPSLVEHTATVSAWGTRLHQACNFDPDWLASPLA